MIEKKLILCSILAIAIGIATIVPVEYFTSINTQANAQTLTQPWFNVNVPYAYYTADATNNQNGIISYGEGYYIALNITTNPNAITTLPNSRLEYYQIRVYSDQGSIENFTYVISANCNGTTNPYTEFAYANANYLSAGDIGYGNLTDLTLPSREWVFLPNFNGTLPATNQPIWESSATYKLSSEGQAISGINESFSNCLANPRNKHDRSLHSTTTIQISNIQKTPTQFTLT